MQQALNINKCKLLIVGGNCVTVHLCVCSSWGFLLFLTKYHTDIHMFNKTADTEIHWWTVYSLVHACAPTHTHTHTHTHAHANVIVLSVLSFQNSLLLNGSLSLISLFQDLNKCCKCFFWSTVSIQLYLCLGHWACFWRNCDRGWWQKLNVFGGRWRKDHSIQLCQGN